MKKFLSTVALVFVLARPLYAIEGHCVYNCDEDSSVPAAPPAVSYAANSLAGSFADGLARGLEINQKARHFNELGNRAYESKDYATAISHYLQALQYVPGNSVVRRSLSWAYGGVLNEKGIRAFNESKWDEAIGFFREGIRYHPGQKDIEANLLEAERQKSLGAVKENQGPREIPVPAPEIPPDFGKKEAVSPLTRPEALPPVNPWLDWIQSALEKTGRALAAAREKFVEWIHSETFELTFGHFPGVSEVKSVVEKFRKWFQELRSTHENILQHTTEGMKEGSRHLANPNDDGRFADQYEKDRRLVGEETSTKARKLAQEAVKSGSN